MPKSILEIDDEQIFPDAIARPFDLILTDNRMRGSNGAGRAREALLADATGRIERT